MKKGVVTANWTTNVESGVAQFQVYSALKQAAPLPVSGTATAPKGNSSSYTVTFASPKSATAKLFLKIKASMTNGPDQWSDAMRAGN